MIRVELPRRRAAEVEHSYSALVECVLSLHVAFDRHGHPLAESRLRALRRLDADLRKRIEAFRPQFESDPSEPFLAWPSSEEPESFEAGLARVSPSAPELRAALVEYWDACFAAEWTRIEPLLAEAVDDARHRLAEHGVVGLFDRLPPGAEADARVLAVESEAEATIVPSPQRPVRFSASAFVWRRILVADEENCPVTVLYAAPTSIRQLHPDAAPSELVEMLSALADDTRLRVLKLIAERPRTAQELAPIVGMSTTGLSKILRKLATAGLLDARREGYYVVYSLNTAQLRTLPLVLEQFLGGEDESRAA
jgi:DNA-binding transcriptional ArsR family regulator